MRYFAPFVKRNIFIFNTPHHRLHGAYPQGEAPLFTQSFTHQKLFILTAILTFAGERYIIYQEASLRGALAWHELAS